MDKTTQDLAWSVLPKEFKEEVKEIYSNAITCHPCGYNHKTDLLKYLFSYHNLTSDAEGEEMLTCEKYKVEEALNYCDELDSISGNNNMRNWGEQMIAYLFGSKCLPDEGQFAKSANCLDPKPADPKFKVGDKVRLKDVYEIEEIDEDQAMVGLKGCAYMEDIDNLEHYTEPKEKADKHFDDIINQSFADHNRLHIAAMLAAGMLASEVRCYPVDRALELADKLIAECEKGDNNA